MAKYDLSVNQLNRAEFDILDQATVDGLWELFIAICDRWKNVELPENLRPQAAALDFLVVPGYTIGGFYRGIVDDLETLCTERGEPFVFSGDPALQVPDDLYWGSGGKVIQVKNLETARKALELIIDQGEGTEGALDVEDNTYFQKENENEVAHYYRFNEIRQGHRYAGTDRPKDPPSGLAFTVDYAATYPIKPDCKAMEYASDPNLRSLNDQFNRDYSHMVLQLNEGFNGNSKVLYSAIMNDMHGLPAKAALIMQMPVPGDPQRRNAMPTFEWVPPVMPSVMIASNDPEERPHPAPAPPMLARALRRAPSFPTRHYPYRKPAAAGGANVAAASVFTGAHPFSGVINRFILGRDTEVRALSGEETAQALRDPFGALLLRRGKFPLTLRAILAELAAFDQQPEGIPKQQAFFVADGGQIAWTPDTAGLARQLRLVLVRHRGGDAELLVSTASPFDSEEVFLQLLAWDPDNLAFNFYERRGGAWIWAGSSWDALAPDTRGHGPFDSHVNGGLVMKELKVPWMHWNSMAITIEPSALAPDDPLRNDPLFTGRDGAESLEKLVRGGLTRWTNARLKRCVTGDTLTRAPEFFRQVLATTTVNLTSSPQVSRTVTADQPLRLPRTFFLHVDALLNELNLGIAFPPPKVDGALYLDCLKRYAVELRDEAFSVPGDTFFAFPVPEPAFEDVIVLRELLTRQFLTRRMAVTLFMVDFPNPVFSPRREQLLAHVPDEVTAADGDGWFQARFVKAIRAAVGSLPQDAPEREFLELWELADDAWEPACVARVNAYLETVGARLADATGAGFDAFFRLAESRRRDFRHRPLSEFSLTLPFTSIPADDPPLEMTAAAEVQPRIASPKSFILSPTNHSTSPTSVMEQFDPPGFLEDLNPPQRAQWSDWISSQLDAVAAGEPDNFDFDAPRPRFFNPLKNPPAADAVERDIRWNAFPRIVQLDAASDTERWQTADASRDVQDEYCEWSATRDPPPTRSRGSPLPAKRRNTGSFSPR